MNNKIIINVGISGSGKSTWTTNFIKENFKTIRCNRDSIRLLLNGTLKGYYQKSNMNDIENFINKIEEDIVVSALYNNYNIIIDNTNLKQSYINKWIKIAQDFNIYHNLKFKLFDCNLNEAKNRVVMRENYTVVLNKEHKNGCLEVKYIEKQFEQYKKIKQFIQQNYAEYILM